MGMPLKILPRVLITMHKLIKQTGEFAIRGYSLRQGLIIKLS